MPWPCRSRSASMPQNYYINHHHHYYAPSVTPNRQLPTANVNPCSDTPWTRPPATHPTRQSPWQTPGQPMESQVAPQPPQVPAWATPGPNTWVPTPLSCAAPLVYTPRAPRPPGQINRHPTFQVPPMFNPPIPGQQTPVFPNSSFLPTPWTQSPFHASIGLQTPQSKNCRMARRREEVNPSVENPLYRNLTEIDWDIRRPVSHAVCFTGAGDLAKLRKHGIATVPWYSHLPIVMSLDPANFEADWATKTVLIWLATWQNTKGHSWASATAVPAENQPLTVKNVLDVLRNYWYEPLTGPEIRYIYSMGLHEAVVNANAERAAIVGEHWSERDDSRLRRIDLLGYNIRFQGFTLVRVDHSIQLTYNLKRDSVGDV